MPDNDKFSFAASADAEDLVAHCLAADPERRADIIEEVCGQRPELANEVREQLQLLADIGLAPEEDQRRSFPERLGEFRLLERLGGGGMGVVYAAWQESLGREVALKLIRPEHLYFPGARERFRREIEAVGQLEHPGIVRVHCVGEEDGIPYLAMERVRGCSLARLMRELKRCSQERLTGDDFRAALKRAVKEQLVSSPVDNDEWTDGWPEGWVETCFHTVKSVAVALEHAHGRGIVHRDIKPSNIMVTCDGRIQLVDFGLATRAGSVKLTQSGSQPGSLAYMSPEQVRGDDVDPHTDVYSLGVVLYEMLTRQDPFFAESSDEVRQLILHAAPKAIRMLNRKVPEDAETVCMKAMAPELGRRYETASEFAADLDRFLKNETVHALPPSTVYRIRKFVKRYRLQVSAAMAVLLTLMLGLVVSTSLWWEADEQRAEAERRADEAVNVSDFLVDLFGKASPIRTLGKEFTVRELLEVGEKRIETALQGQQSTRARLLATFGKVEFWFGRYDQSVKFLSEAVRLSDKVEGLDDITPYIWRNELVLALLLAGKIQRADELSTHNLSLLRKNWGDDSPAVPELMVVRAQVLKAMGHNDEAIKILELALPVLRASQSKSAKLPLARALGHLAGAYFNVNRFKKARPLLEECNALLRVLFPNGHPETVQALRAWALCLAAQNEPDLAEKAITSALSEAKRFYANSVHPEIARVLLVFATILRKNGREHDAATYARRALAIDEKCLGPDNPQLAWSLNDLAVQIMIQADYEDAKKLLERAIEIYRRAYAKGHPHLAISLTNLADALQHLDDLDAALRYAREGLAMKDKFLPIEPDNIVRSLGLLSQIQIKRGEFSLAESLLRRSIEVLKGSSDKNWPLGIAHSRLAYIYNRSGKGKKAELEAKRAYELLESVHKRDDGDRALLLYNRAWALLLLKDFSRAEPWFKRSIAMFKRLYPNGHPDAAWPLSHYGITLVKDRPLEAIPHLQEALEIRNRFLRRGDYWRLVSVANLGVAQLKLGEFAKAEPLLLEVYDIRKEGDGSSGQRTRNVLQLIIKLYRRWEKDDKLEQFKALLRDSRKDKE